MEIEEREILRYLGYGKEKPDENTQNLIHECKFQIKESLECKSINMRFPLTKDRLNEGIIRICDEQFVSRDLSKNLADCDEVILFAATLGRGTDLLLSRLQKNNMQKAVIAMAVANAATEAYCNECVTQIAHKLAKEKLFLRPRYSPGYGDLSLECQPRLLGLIEAQKRAGIYLTEGGIMLPEKSVSAFIGITNKNTKCVMEGCEECKNKNCPYRRLSGEETNG